MRAVSEEGFAEPPHNPTATATSFETVKSSGRLTREQPHLIQLLGVYF